MSKTSGNKDGKQARFKRAPKRGVNPLIHLANRAAKLTDEIEQATTPDSLAKHVQCNFETLLVRRQISWLQEAAQKLVSLIDSMVRAVEEAQSDEAQSGETQSDPEIDFLLNQFQVIISHSEEQFLDGKRMMEKKIPLDVGPFKHINETEMVLLPADERMAIYQWYVQAKALLDSMKERVSMEAVGIKELEREFLLCCSDHPHNDLGDLTAIPRKGR